MKILHTADWHIGQFKGPVVDGVNLRSQDTVKCLEYMVQVAIEEKPDIVCVSGDIFHQEQVGPVRYQLEILLLGRRKADGNYVGKDNIYTNSAGITRYSPLAEWRHEDILAYIHYYDVKLPPIYDWEKGYLCGTHPWPARQYMETEQQGWKEVYDIDKTIVENAAQHFDGAREFLKAIK